MAGRTRSKSVGSDWRVGWWQPITLGHRVSHPFCEGQRGGRCRTGLRAAGAEAGGALTRSRRRVAPPRHGDYLRRRFPRRTPDSRISHQHTTIPAREAERNGHRECSARSANGSRVDMRSHQQTPPLASATNACPLRMHCILRSWPAMTDVPPSQTCPRWDSNSISTPSQRPLQESNCENSSL